MLMWVKSKVEWVTALVLMTALFGCDGCDREVYVVKGNALIVTGSDLVDFGEVPVGFRISRNLQVLNRVNRTHHRGFRTKVK